MKFFNSMSTAHKLSFGFGLCLVLASIMGASAITRMSQMADVSRQITGETLAETLMTSDLIGDAKQIRLDELKHLLSDDKSEEAALEQQMDTVESGFTKAIDTYEKSAKAPEDKELARSFREAWEAYYADHARQIEYGRKNDVKNGLPLFSKERRPKFKVVEDLLQRIQDLNEKQGAAATAEAAQAYSTGRTTVVSLLALTICIGVIVGVIITKLITSILVQVRDSSETIVSAATQVSSGNEDLAQRTEEQAASLEETASSMEEMTSTVRQSADNSKLANQLAAQARQVAEDGGLVVRGAVSAMGEINEGSKRIAEIVSVIDDIAFQTNLLALNAAVEAARVGEQGRGFAVVAAEVRSLAGRSATAAKEIKSLVQDSVAKVQTGSDLVNQSGTSLDEIVTAVKKVADIIAEISAASLEQAAGIEQVNKAIMQMDQVTQQNAGLVEEVSASSRSMSHVAHDLRALVEKYMPDTRNSTPVSRTSHLSVQHGDARPAELAATGTTGRAEWSPRARPVKTKLTVHDSDEGFEKF